MSRHVAIIGCGHVGADVAFSLVSRNLADHISLFDSNTAKAASEALELQDMIALVNSRVHIDANEQALLGAADIVIMAIGPKQTERVDRLHELKETSVAAAKWVPLLKESGFDGVVIDITNPCDVVTAHLARLLALPEGRVFGTGTLLDTARMRRVVGRTLNIDPRSVEGYVLGEHGDSQFVAWSAVRVGGQPLQQWPYQGDFPLVDMEQEVRRGGWNVLAGKGWTSFGIGTAAATLADAVFSDAQCVYPVSAPNEQWGIHIGQPAIIGANGVVQTLSLPLTDQEQQRFAESAQVISNALASLD